MVGLNVVVSWIATCTNPKETSIYIYASVYFVCYSRTKRNYTITSFWFRRGWSYQWTAWLVWWHFSIVLHVSFKRYNAYIDPSLHSNLLKHNDLLLITFKWRLTFICSWSSSIFYLPLQLTFIYSWSSSTVDFHLQLTFIYILPSSTVDFHLQLTFIYNWPSSFFDLHLQWTFIYSWPSDDHDIDCIFSKCIPKQKFSFLIISHWHKRIQVHIVMI